MRNKFGKLGAVAIASLALAFGASEAFASQSSLRSEPCSEDYNWCQAGEGPGDYNCTDCCIRTGNYTGGLCLSYEIAPWQGCICTSG